MAATFTLTSFAAHLAGAVTLMEATQRAGLEVACQIVENAAKDAIGTYEYGWPPLAESTLQKKAFDTPLLETGQLRDSIDHVVESATEASVGSNEDTAVWQELGTSRGIPPRSFLAESARRHSHEVALILQRAVCMQLVAGGAAFPHITPSTTPIP